MLEDPTVVARTESYAKQMKRETVVV